jgi:hypothetical protein
MSIIAFSFSRGVNLKKTNSSFVMNFLAEGSRGILYRPIFRDVAGSVTASILLSQIIYWSQKSNWDWFYKFKDDWKEELNFSKEEFDLARKKLKDKDLIEWEVRGFERKTYYILNTENLEAEINKVYSGKSVEKAEPLKRTKNKDSHKNISEIVAEKPQKKSSVQEPPKQNGNFLSEYEKRVISESGKKRDENIFTPTSDLEKIKEVWQKHGLEVGAIGEKTQQNLYEVLNNRVSVDDFISMINLVVAEFNQSKDTREFERPFKNNTLAQLINFRIYDNSYSSEFKKEFRAGNDESYIDYAIGKIKNENREKAFKVGNFTENYLKALSLNEELESFKTERAKFDNPVKELEFTKNYLIDKLGFDKDNTAEDLKKKAKEVGFGNNEFNMTPVTERTQELGEMFKKLCENFNFFESKFSDPEKRNELYRIYKNQDLTNWRQLSRFEEYIRSKIGHVELSRIESDYVALLGYLEAEKSNAVKYATSENLGHIVKIVEHGHYASPLVSSFARYLENFETYDNKQQDERLVAILRDNDVEISELKTYANNYEKRASAM